MEAKDHQARASVMHCGNGELILLVDDTPSVIDALQSLLSEFNYRTLTVTDGSAGFWLWLSRQKEIALSIIDFDMPGLSGGELFKLMRRVDPAAKVLFHTGTQDEENLCELEKFSKLPGVGFISKPSTAKRLTAEIHALLSEQARGPVVS